MGEHTLDKGNSNRNGRWTRETLIEYIRETTGQANIISTPKLFVKMCGNDIVVALVLGQIVYWSDKTTDEAGWFYKKQSEWEEEIGVSDYQLTRAIKKLEPFGVEMEVRQADKAPTRHFKLDWAKFLKTVGAFLDSRGTERGDEIQETSKTNNTYSQPPTTNTPIPPQKLREWLVVELADHEQPLLNGRAKRYEKDLQDLVDEIPDISAESLWAVAQRIKERWLEKEHYKLSVEQAYEDVLAGKVPKADLDEKPRRRSSGRNSRRSDRAATVTEIGDAKQRKQGYEWLFGEAVVEGKEESLQAIREKLEEAMREGGVEGLEDMHDQLLRRLVAYPGVLGSEVRIITDELLMGAEIG